MNSYCLLPFQFQYVDIDTVLLVNECGDFVYLGARDFDSFIRHGLSSSSPAFGKLKSHLFLAQKETSIALEKTAARYRTRKSFLREFTSLHMMVITLRCNQKCRYCQVSCAEENATDFDMDVKTAYQIVDMIFQAPTRTPKIEFQGGEPLLNWPVLEETVRYAEERAREVGKNVEFVVCTNLTVATRNQLEFCREHGVAISTSLDGPEALHNMCRVFKSGDGTYARFLEKLALAREILGTNSVDALMTTTALNVDLLSEVVDEYVARGFSGIFLRSLNPYGFASERADRLGYSAEHFAERYLEALDYILELNRRVFFPEHFATLLFTRILTPYATGFVDLQSPAGVGIAGAIYDHDGSIYPSDEARMLARMGDRHFCLGNVHTDSYDAIFNGKKLRRIINNSCVETTAPCAYCVYQAYCGTDPVRNYLETGDVCRNMSGTGFCTKNRLIFDGLFKLLREADEETLDIIWSWIHRDPGMVDHGKA